MDQYNKMTTEELRAKAIALVMAMTDEQAALVLRILDANDRKTGSNAPPQTNTRNHPTH